MTRISARYKKGFKEGYNNPNQYHTDKLLTSNDDLIKGLIAGKLKRIKVRTTGKDKFIWSEKEMKR